MSAKSRGGRKQNISIKQTNKYSAKRLKCNTESLSRQSKQNQVNLFYQQSRWMTGRGGGRKEGERLLHFKAIVAAAGNPSMRQSRATVQPATATAFVSALLLHCVAQITFVIVTVMRIEFSLQLATARTVGCVSLCVCVCNLPVATPNTSHMWHTQSLPPSPSLTLGNISSAPLGHWLSFYRNWI